MTPKQSTVSEQHKAAIDLAAVAGQRPPAEALPPLAENSYRGHSWAVVLAGGDGARLQELSRVVSGDNRPKQFCPFFEEKSLLTHTRERIAPLFHEERTLFVLTRAHEAYYGQDLPEVHDWRRLVQPANRGTAVAMALSLNAIVRRDEEALVAFFPSDHHYSDCSAFRACVNSALFMASEFPHSILMLGAEARYPEVEYGWIEPGRTMVDCPVRSLYRVSRFWEKPDLPSARMLQEQGCLWNTFVTIGLASAFIEVLDATLPRLARSLQTSSYNNRLDELYGRIDPADFSKDVLTRVPHRLLVLRDAASGWTDLGSPRRVIDVLARHTGRPSWLPSAQELQEYAPQASMQGRTG